MSEELRGDSPSGLAANAPVSLGFELTFLSEFKWVGLAGAWPRRKAARLYKSSTRQSAKFTFDYVVCLKFIDVFDIISIWIGLIITDLP